MLGKRYDDSIEQKWRHEWANQKVYRFDPNDKTRKLYTIDTPPAFTSGKLHMGHVLSYSYFDFVARYKRMKGFNVYYPQGWDCQGFPTEVRVEKEHKITGTKEPEKFVKLCTQWTDNMISKMKEQMNVMGFSADWDYEYRTMSPEYHKAVQYSLLKMYDKKEVYNAEHPVYWCTYDVSAIAKSETEEVERQTKLIYIKFRADMAKGYVEIATTRPELLHACVAVMVHPNDEKYKHLIGRTVKTPLGKEVKVIADNDVDKEFGSGAVMVCTFGDKQDVVWVYRHKLPVIKAMDETGKIINSLFYNGLKYKQARDKVIKKIKEDNNFVKDETITQSIKVHDRCKNPVELLLSKQWFIKVKDKKKEIIASAKKIKWFPEFGITYLINWAEYVEWDWVISRHRAFGTPIPFWYCDKCSKWYPASEHELPVDPRIQSRKCPGCCELMHGEQSVLDCWVDSSITPLFIAGWPDKFDKAKYPCDLRPQGVEIVRSWAYYTIMRCTFLTGKVPFRHILLNGNVLAPDGKKMSKSQGNVIKPDKLLKEYPVDALRQWAAMSGAMAKDRPFSYQDMKYAKSFLTKLWNTARFIEMHLHDYKYNENDAKELRMVDLWILMRLNRVIEKVTEHMENYEFHHAVKEIQNFTWHELCDYYLEYVKYRLYDKDKSIGNPARYTLHNVLITLVKLLAPFTPHISEEIYHQVFNKNPLNKPNKTEFLVSCSWPLPRHEWDKDNAMLLAGHLKTVIDYVREYKAGNKLSMKAEFPVLTIKTNTEINNIIEEIKQTCHARKIVIEKGNGFEVVI